MAKHTHQSNIFEGCYGDYILTSEVKRWLLDNLLDNMSRDIRITLNIWSAPGVGKTTLVKSLEKEPVEWRHKKWDGFRIIDIPLAQIEEMGDKLSEDDKKSLEEKTVVLEEAVNAKDIEKIDAAQKELQTVWYSISAKLYAQENPQGNPAETILNPDGSFFNGNMNS